jgi:hypothetical protein
MGSWKISFGGQLNAKSLIWSSWEHCYISMAKVEHLRGKVLLLDALR